MYTVHQCVRYAICAFHGTRNHGLLNFRLLFARAVTSADEVDCAGILGLLRCLKFLIGAEEVEGAIDCSDVSKSSFIARP